MTFTSEPIKILKVDQLGRVRTPVERREMLLDEFERSGMTGVKFAATIGVKYPTFALWVQKRRKTREEANGGATRREAPVQLLEAVADVRFGSGLVIELPGGARAQVSSATQASLVVEILRQLTNSARSC